MCKAPRSTNRLVSSNNARRTGLTYVAAPIVSAVFRLRGGANRRPPSRTRSCSCSALPPTIRLDPGLPVWFDASVGRSRSRSRARPRLPRLPAVEAQSLREVACDGAAHRADRRKHVALTCMPWRNRAAGMTAFWIPTTTTSLIDGDRSSCGRLVRPRRRVLHADAAERWRLRLRVSSSSIWSARSRGTPRSSRNSASSTAI